MQQRWITIHRKILDNFLWEDKPFSRGQAWIDLLLIANHEDKTTLFNGKTIEVKRGQKITSLRQLSDRWGWSISKVKYFFQQLKCEKMLDYKSDTKKTVYTIVNYSDYQEYKEDKNNTKITPKENKNKTERKQKITNNNDNNDNNDNNILYTLVCNLWNDLSENIPKVNFIKNNSTRSKHLKARIEEVGEEKFFEVLKSISNSDFLCGKNKNNWTITFDWFINASNFAKVMEGNYNNRTTQKQDTNEFKNYGELI